MTLRFDGYRTDTEDIYMRPDSTFKLTDTIGETGSWRGQRRGAVAAAPERAPEQRNACAGQQYRATAVRTRPRPVSPDERPSRPLAVRRIFRSQANEAIRT